ncbi:MAG TPA: NrtA/SsuA/CpmA family ABC transporter substrate-binding protein [Syntrophorhabdaceae bacterium]
MKKSGLFALTALIPAFMSTLLIALSGCAPPAGRDEIKLAAISANVMGLFFVADGRRLFEKNGLSPALKVYQSGPLGLKHLEEGTADVATAADFAFVAHSFKASNLRVIGAIGKGGGMQIIARRGRGIAKPADLQGKTVAVPKGTVAQFFLGAYLQRNGIPYQKVRAVYLPPAEVVEAMRKGTATAACVWSPYIEEIRDILGKEAVFLQSHGRTDYYALLVTRDDVIRERPAVLEKLLKAMSDAEAFTKAHPEEAMGIIAKATGLTMDQVRRGWSENKYEVRMDQGLLALMEAEAHWMIRNNLTSKRKMPNFLDLIDVRAMKAVKPEAIGIIHRESDRH